MHTIIYHKLLSNCALTALRSVCQEFILSIGYKLKTMKSIDWHLLFGFPVSLSLSHTLSPPHTLSLFRSLCVCLAYAILWPHSAAYIKTALYICLYMICLCTYYIRTDNYALNISIFSQTGFLANNYNHNNRIICLGNMRHDMVGLGDTKRF